MYQVECVDWPAPPVPAPPATSAMLDRVQALAGGRPYVLVHDEPDRPIALPEGLDRAVVLHMRDARFASQTLADYADVLRGAQHLHTVAGCLVDLVRAVAPDTPVTIHAYAGACRSDGCAALETLHHPPTPALFGAHLLPPDEVGRALRSNFRHFVALQQIIAPTRDAWHPCGSYLMGPDGMEYDPSMHAKQALLFDRAKGVRNALEVGVHGGHSLLLLLIANPHSHVTCVDACVWDHTALCVDYLRREFPGRITLLRGPSDRVLPLVDDAFDFIHIDGDHSYEGAKSDMLHAHRLSHERTAFVFDDFCNGIARAAMELSHLFEIVEVPHCAWNNCLARRREHALSSA